ncbi:MAG: PA14 domain-containing protein, partial [Rhodospirillales bacterium]|nr:PA14 domain-containing protein [Rhodospirillales bacterium]
ESDGDFTDYTGDKVTLVAIGDFDGVTHEVRAVVTPGAETTQTIVLIAGNGSSPSSQDLARKTLFESWGYIVTVLGDSDSQAEYDAALADADVVYISEEASSGDVHGKIDDTTLGVVIEELYNHDTFGLTSGNGDEFTDNEIDIVDDSHYITSEFGTGSLTITSSNEPLVRAGSSTIASGATVLAEQDGGSRSVLAVIEVGGGLIDGSSAAGRRVFLPIAGGSFDYNELNADGQTLVQRAIAWAAASPSYLSGLIAQHYHESSSLDQLSDVNWNRTPDHTEIVSQVNWSATSGSFYSGGPTNRFGVKVYGYIDIPEAGNWNFYLTHNNGATLSIGGSTVINNDILGSTSSVSGSANLSQDRHDFVIYLFENTSTAALVLEWEGPSQAREVIPANALTYAGGGDPGESEDTGDPPQLIALYEFAESTSLPNLVGYWKLDDSTTSGGSGGIVAMGDKLYVINGSQIDSYDSSAGDYGGSNRNSNAVVTTNSTSSNRIDIGDGQIRGDAYAGVGGNPNSVISGSVTGSKTALTSPVDVDQATDASGMPGHSGNKTHNGGNHTLGSDGASTDIHYNKWTFNNSAKVTVRGDMRIRVNNNMVMNDGRIILASGATLKLYVNNGLTMANDSYINNDSSRASDVEVHVFGNNKDLTMNGDNIISGAVFVDRDVEMNNGSQIYGSIVAGDDITINDGDIHIDEALTNVSGIGGGGGGGSGTATDEQAVSNGTYNGPIGGSTGHDGTAPEFDGSDDYIEISHHNAYLLDHGTVSFWFRSDNLSGEHGLLSKDSSGYDNGGHLHIYTDGAQLKAQLGSTTANHAVSSASVLSTGTWYHVALTWGTGGVRLYLNGSLVDSETYYGGTGTTSGGSGNYEPIVLGADATGSGDTAATPLDDYFDGRIDDVRIYDQPLDSGQITNVYNGSDPGARTDPGYIVRDTSSFGTALDLYIEEPTNITWPGSNGLTFTGDTVAASVVSAT